MTLPVAQPSFLATRRGKLTLALLCAVAFLDFVDASIVNIALPDIRNDLKFSVQGLQWVLRLMRDPDAERRARASFESLLHARAMPTA